MPYIAINRIGAPRPPGHVAAGQRLKHGTINQIIDSIVGARQIRQQRLRYIAHGRVYRGPFNGRLNTNGTSIDVSDGLVSLGKTRRRFAIGGATESTAFENVDFAAFTDSTVFIVCRAFPLSIVSTNEIRFDFFSTLDPPSQNSAILSGLGFVDIYIGKVETDSSGIARNYEQIQQDNFYQDFYDDPHSGYMNESPDPTAITVERGLIYKGTEAVEDGRGLTISVAIPLGVGPIIVFLTIEAGNLTFISQQSGPPGQSSDNIKIVIGEATTDGTKITKWLQRWHAGDIYVPRHCDGAGSLVVTLDGECT